MLQQTADMLYTGVHSWLPFQEILPDLAHECSKAHEGQCIILGEDQQER